MNAIDGIDRTPQYVTVDTNLYEDADLRAIGAALSYIHLYSTKISEEELQGEEIIMGHHIESVAWGQIAWGEVNLQPNRSIPAPFVIGVSKLGGNDVIASEHLQKNLLKDILKIATNGSFRLPQDLSSQHRGVQNQLKDALILLSHCNRSHTILVSNDYRFFGRNAESPLRQKLEGLTGTKIMSSVEFIEKYRRHLPNLKLSSI